MWIVFLSQATDETITKFSATIDLAEEGFDSTLATVVGTDSIAAGAAHVHGVQADAVGQVSNKKESQTKCHEKQASKRKTSQTARDWRCGLADGRRNNGLGR